jgi:membrane protein DedA with SNARE-associated domain
MSAYLEHLLHAYGYVAVFAIIAVENIGLLVPGETILISASIFAATTHELNLIGIILTAASAAFAGSVAGCAIGRYGERHVLHRYGRYLHIDERDLRLGRYLFRRYGGRVVFVARYVAFLRAVAGLIAGINGMPWKPFLFFSALGAVAWAATFGVGAYVLGTRIEQLSFHAGVVITAIVAVAVVAGFRFLQHNRARLQREADYTAGVKEADAPPA